MLKKNTRMSQQISQFWICCWFGIVLAATGCQQRNAAKLVGSWVGKPDSAAARAEREAAKYDDLVSVEPDEGEEAPKVSQAEHVAERSDWEAYDVEVELEFTDLQHVKLALADGSQPIDGRWVVIETSPTGLTIEIISGEEPPPPTRRRFLVELDEREGDTFGFLLSEVGTDRQLGSLYFTSRQRPGP
jgi:hypothetical protein